MLLGLSPFLFAEINSSALEKTLSAGTDVAGVHSTAVLDTGCHFVSTTKVGLLFGHCSCAVGTITSQQRLQRWVFSVMLLMPLAHRRLSTILSLLSVLLLL